ncbi:hypothetical protein HMI54_003150 [Coelomomyces lativittatus]|nr:hypothetical protein HMI56_001238 [Coelomomyces lativittatus]KAJ1508557.1 hypothetical protein HMI54_003150 [Coelomomyces lativittatus]KAJ1511656.1 hypothetical protein HMI55_006506 [Coelomomyces lativittatus]
MERVKIMEATHLVTLLRDQSLKAGIDYLVIDVRDDDFEGGNIPGAYHLPSQTLFHAHPTHSQVLQIHLEKFKRIPLLVFHCALSQQRGPKAASYFAQQLSSTHSNQIYVLKGGFSHWQAHFGHEVGLVENLDPLKME